MDKEVRHRACSRRIFTQDVSVWSRSCLGRVSVLSRRSFGVSVTSRCLGDVLIMFPGGLGCVRCCFSDVSMVFEWFFRPVPVVSQWCFSDVLVMLWWCLGYVLMFVFHGCFGATSEMFKWFFGDVSDVSRCSRHVLVMFWWSSSDVLVMSGACSGDVFVMCGDCVVMFWWYWYWYCMWVMPGFCAVMSLLWCLRDGVAVFWYW